MPTTKAENQKLRAIRPDISLSSDFIIGFPGETEQDFGHTMALIDEIGFDHRSALSTAGARARRPPTCLTMSRTHPSRRVWRNCNT